MSDPVFTPAHYLMAHDIVSSLEKDLAIHFQMEGVNWSRETMQNHVNDRAALLRVGNLLLDAGEKHITKEGGDAK